VGGVDTIPVDARILATSNRDLEEAVSRGDFREDLFFRLDVITIHLPPLRERTEDLPALMDRFLERSNRENGRSISGFSAAARKLFAEYTWPGNVRELQNAVERAVVLFDDPILEPRHFQLSAPSAAGRMASAGPGATVAEMERELILQTLEHCAQNRTRAAEMLGIAVRTLRNKLKEYREAGLIDCDP